VRGHKALLSTAFSHPETYLKYQVTHKEALVRQKDKITLFGL
jgi:hypothetical protein